MATLTIAHIHINWYFLLELEFRTISFPFCIMLAFDFVLFPILLCSMVIPLSSFQQQSACWAIFCSTTSRWLDDCALRSLYVRNPIHTLAIYKFWLWIIDLSIQASSFNVWRIRWNSLSKYSTQTNENKSALPQWPHIYRHTYHFLFFIASLFRSHIHWIGNFCGKRRIIRVCGG